LLSLTSVPASDLKSLSARLSLLMHVEGKTISLPHLVVADDAF
jgi:hypothetical protein